MLKVHQISVAFACILMTYLLTDISLLVTFEIQTTGRSVSKEAI